MNLQPDVGDFELLESWRRGDSEAGSKLLRRHQAALARFFQNKAAYGADDLVQKTMIAAMEGRDRFEGRSTFRAFLFSIARYTLYEHYRRDRQNQDLLEYNTVTLVDICPSPSVQIAERDEQRVLLEALRRIPVNLQIALELSYWEDLTGPELAEILEIPLDTVYSRLRRAKELLRKKLMVVECSPVVRSSTVDNLADWARSIRGQVPGELGDASQSEPESARPPEQVTPED